MNRQIWKGIQNPNLIKRNLRFKINSYRRFDYAINGAYWTGNVGDRAISQVFLDILSSNNESIGLFPAKIDGTRSKVHILGGGGVLRDCNSAEHGNEPDVLRNKLNWVSECDKSAIIGVGVPGFKQPESKELIKSKLSNVELITVRDRWSHNKLQEYYDGQIYETACPTFLLEDPEETKGDYIGVNFRPWPNYSSDIMSYHFNYDFDSNINDQRKKYIKNAENICGALDNPIFIPFAKEDVEFAKENLNIKVLPYSPSPTDTLKRVSSVKKMVAMRYHSLVFSAVTSTPVMAISYQPKVSYLSDRLNIPSYYPNESFIPIKFKEPDNIGKIKRKARTNFDLIDEL